MRLFYADPGLINNHGHHANVCRSITRAARARGIETRVLGYSKMSAALQQELGARAHFNLHTYWSDPDPIGGWLRTFQIVAAKVHDELEALAEIQSDDVVYFNSALPSHLMAIAAWLTTRGPNHAPRVFVEFGHDPGVDPQTWPPQGTYLTRDPRTDARASLYRAAGLQMPEWSRTRVHLGTFEPHCSAMYAALLGLAVHTFPVSQTPHTAPRNRAGANPLTLALLGTQRRDKGYHLAPEIVRQLLEANPTVRCLVHNSGPDWMPAARDLLRAHARTEPRLLLNESAADDSAWDQLLERVDLILCPYEPIRYHASYSAVAVEAVSRGIPIIGPAESSLARLVREYDGCGTTFPTFDVAAIVAATLEALQDFDRYARLAHAAAPRWARRNGADKFVDGMFAGTAEAIAAAFPSTMGADLKVISPVQPPNPF